MAQPGDTGRSILNMLVSELDEQYEGCTFPPPVFVSMQGRFVSFDAESESLTARFPVLESALNPYGAMQGGMVAAAVDNTLGPLSVLVAPPNLTRHLEITYQRPVTPEMETIDVFAQLVERRGRRLYFKATVRSQEGQRLARAKAMHWVLGDCR